MLKEIKLAREIVDQLTVEQLMEVVFQVESLYNTGEINEEEAEFILALVTATAIDRFVAQVELEQVAMVN